MSFLKKRSKAAQEPVDITNQSRDPDEYASSCHPEFEHLICFICEGVFHDPVQCPNEHYFCKDCVKQWLRKHETCPVDLKELSENDLKAAPKILRDIISSLHLKCRYHVFGCQQLVYPGTKREPSSMVREHTASCQFRLWALVHHDYNLVPQREHQQDQRQGHGGDTGLEPEVVTLD